jgi:hypothetical protein
MKAKTLQGKTLALVVGSALLGLSAAGGVRAEVYGIAATEEHDGSVRSTSFSAGASGSAAPVMAGAGPFSANAGQGQATTTIVGGFGNPLGLGSSARSTAQASPSGALTGSLSATGLSAYAGNFLLVTLTGTTAAMLTLSFTSDANIVASPNVAAGPDNAAAATDPFGLQQETSSVGAQGPVVGDGSGVGPVAGSAYALSPGAGLLGRTDAGISAAPEPSSILLTALALTALGFTGRRKAD